jgi:hypothetical protein
MMKLLYVVASSASMCGRMIYVLVIPKRKSRLIGAGLYEMGY